MNTKSGELIFFNKILLELGNESSELRDKYVAFLHDNALDKDIMPLYL